MTSILSDGTIHLNIKNVNHEISFSLRSSYFDRPSVTECRNKKKCRNKSHFKTQHLFEMTLLIVSRSHLGLRKTLPNDMKREVQKSVEIYVT